MIKSNMWEGIVPPINNRAADSKPMVRERRQGSGGVNSEVRSFSIVKSILKRKYPCIISQKIVTDKRSVLLLSIPFVGVAKFNLQMTQHAFSTLNKPQSSS